MNAEAAAVAALGVMLDLSKGGLAEDPRLLRPNMAAVEGLLASLVNIFYQPRAKMKILLW